MSSNQNYEVVYLPAAKKDLNEIISYIQTDAPEAALNFLGKIDKNISQLKHFPYKGKKLTMKVYNLKDIRFLSLEFTLYFM